MKNIVIALGGNALLRKGEPKTFEYQAKNVEITVEKLIDIFKNGLNVVMTHGNGPQVGIEVLRNLCLQEKFPPFPLDALNANTEGWIGYIMARTLRNYFKKHGIKREVVAMVTQVVVDKDDPGFKNPSKPVGDFMTEEEAKELARKYGWIVKEDAGRGWRRVVPSPVPKRTVEAPVIKKLYEEGTVVIASGGGGVPVTEEDGILKGAQAVIDKDRASALLALEIGAKILVILTQVPYAYINFGKPDQKELREVSLKEIKAYYEEGHFAAGSMGPKVEAAITFLENGGEEVIITSIERAREALDRKAGTIITP